MSTLETFLDEIEHETIRELNRAKAALPDTRDYPTIRREYRLSIYAAVVGYLDSAGAITRWKNAARRAVIDHFPESFYVGYAEGGAEEVEDGDERWLTGRMNEELGYLDDLFASLRDLRGTVDADAEAQLRADGYAATLDAVYAEGILRGKKNQMLTWHYGDTDHCDTCAKLDEQRHSAKWYVQRDYIPRKPGAAMDCGGYRCQCYLETDAGEIITIGA